MLSAIVCVTLLGTLVYADDATTTVVDTTIPVVQTVETTTQPVVQDVQAKTTEETTTEENTDENVLTLDDSKDLDALKNFEGIVRQSTDFNCGPAALATLLTQLGYPTSESQVTDLYKANSEKGIDLLSLKKASIEIGKDFGFKTYLKKWTLDDIQEYVTRTGNPVLVHDIKKGVGGHYSVIREIKNGTAYVSDTEAGNIEFSVEEYSHAFDGYVLIATENVSDVAVDNDVSDEEAATVWGKYVPVYMSADSVLAVGGSTGVANFKACMLKPNIVQTTNIALRNSERALCYASLAKDLAAGMGILGDTKVVTEVEASKLLNTSVDLEDTSIGSIVGKLKGELSVLQGQLNAVTTLVAPVTNYVNITNQINLIKSNIVTLQNSIASKQTLLNTANSNLSSIALALGTLNQQISAKTSNIASISANASRLLTSYDAMVNSYLNQINTANSNIGYWQTQVSNAQASVNYFYNQYYYVKNGKTSYNLSNYNAWVSNLNNANANLNAYKTQLNTATSNYNYYKQLQTNAQNSSANSQSASEQAALNSLRTQLQNKQLEQQRVTDSKNSLQIDINNYNNQISGYNTQIANYNTQIENNYNVPLRNTERTRINSLIASKQAEITAEQAFIDSQESMVQGAVKSDLDKEIPAKIPLTDLLKISFFGGVVQGLFGFFEGTYNLATALFFNFKGTLASLSSITVNQIASATVEGLKGRTNTIIQIDPNSFISIYAAGSSVGKTAFDVCTIGCTLGAGAVVKGVKVAEVAVDVTNGANKAAEIAKVAEVINAVKLAKILSLFKNAKTADEIYNIANANKIAEVSQGTTAVIAGSSDAADGIVSQLKNLGWKQGITNYSKIDNSPIYTYTSPNNLESINVRTFSSSAAEVTSKGYTLEKTIDVMKYLLNGVKDSNYPTKEIKFVIK